MFLCMHALFIYLYASQIRKFIFRYVYFTEIKSASQKYLLQERVGREKQERKKTNNQDNHI